MTKLAIVGIDGATYEIIRPMIAAGELPHIGRILNEGVSGDLESEKPPMTPPAWTSMFTGINPGKHGVFHFIRRNLGTYGVLLNDSRNYLSKDVMSLLSNRGWSVGSLSVPMTYPPFPVQDGYMVSGIPMPLTGDTIAWPPGTVAEMEEILGRPYEPDVDYAPYDGDTETDSDDLSRYAVLRDHLFKIERDRLKLQAHYLKNKPTDFYFTVVSVTDRCQHYFWKFQDRSHAGWTEEGEKLYGEVIKDSYRLADEFVGEARAILGDDVPISLVSDHGFGSHNVDFHVNKWLEDEGFQVRRQTPYWTVAKMHLKDVLGKVGLGGVGKAIGPLGKIPLFKPKKCTVPSQRDIVWSKTKAFAAMHGICINRVGREPEGVVEGEAAYQQAMTEVREALAKIIGPDGKPATDFSLDKDDIYSGPRTVEAPDIQFQMMDLSCITKEAWDDSQTFGERKNAMISGQHRFNGIFAVQAPGLEAGKVLEGMHIQDTAPTLLYMVGEAVPTWMDGKIRGDLYANPEQPIWDDTPEPDLGSGGGSDNPALDDEQNKAIEESLRGLGYLQ
ncbi:MAG: alkaline phosphatase family protein [Planctomycetota bacterium]|nr:alkaline phosphatase family protein [Planctomycetota bacterium]MDA1113974.1 alkaline phosphatase family protein [Planctomycetota bacterium]